MKKLLLIGVVLVIVAVVVTTYLRGTQAADAPEFMTASVTRGDVVETVEATGALEAVITVQVGTQVSGSIKTLHADFNSRVRQGQVIAELDPSLFQTQVEQARATLVRVQADVDRARVQLDDARVKLSRAKELSTRQLIPMADLETAEVNARAAESAVKSAEAQLVQARASLNQVEVNLNHTVIRSPIDGIVVSRNVDVGQTVAASMQAPTLYVLARDLSEMQVNASIDESDIGRIQQAQSVTFRVDAYPGETFTGAVRQVRLQPVVQQNVVSYTTVITVPNPQLKLKPGMTATVTVEVARADDVVRVPTSALRFRPTPEIFAALGQEEPRSPETASDPTASATSQQGAAAPAPATSQADPRRSAVGDSQPSAGQPARVDSPGGRGRGATADGRRRRFGDMTAEEREQMRERFQQMSPEQREQMRRQRMQQMTSDERSSNGPSTARRAGPSTELRADERRDGAAPEGRNFSSAAVQRGGRVWVLADGQLRPVRVRTGISDGANTAILAGDLPPGATVVTGVVSEAAPAPATSGSPLLPRRPNFGRGRGAPGR